MKSYINHCVQLNLMTFNVLQEIGESTSEEDQAKLDKTKVYNMTMYWYNINFSI
jgi:hypothetical protein